MLGGVKEVKFTDLGGGVNTLPNIFSIQPNQSPASLNVEFEIGGTVAKRLGTTSLNTTVLVSSAATGFSPDSNATLSGQMISFWKLDEANGDRKDQFDGNTLTQQGSGNILSSSGVVINAVSYVIANSQHLFIPSNSDLQTGDIQFSYAGWFNLSTTGVRTIFSKRLGSINSSDTRNLTFYQAASDTSLSIGNPGGSQFQRNAQSFKVNRPYTVSAVAAMLKVSQDTPGELQFRIETDSAGLPSGTLASTSAAGLIQQGSVSSTDANFVIATLSAGGVTLDAGTSYWIVGRLTDDSNGSPRDYLWFQDTVAPNYADGNSARQDGATAWVAQPGNDLLFRIIGYEKPAQFESWLYVNTDNIVTWRLSSSGLGEDVTIQATSFGAVGTSTWYHAVAWHDSIANNAGISVNLHANSSAYTSGVFSGNAPFTLGATGSGLTVGGFMDGRQDESGFWKKVLTAQQRSDLFNGGAGNTFNSGNNQAGWGSFDFGGGTSIRWYMVSAGTGIVASSNRGTTFVTVATDRSAAYQSFAFSKTHVLATSDSRDSVLIWPGSVGTFMTQLAPGSAPAAKFATDFAGFTFLMNSAQRPRGVFYADNNTFTTSAWTDTFEIPANTDDEITGSGILSGKLYIYTQQRIFRISPVGGNPDFSVREMKNSFGAVPRTIEKIPLPEVGEVLIGLGFDRRLHVFDGAEDKVISDIVFDNNGMVDASLAGINLTSIHTSFAEFDDAKQYYRIALAMAPSTLPTHWLNLNVRNGAYFWSRYPYTFTTGIMATSANMSDFMAVTNDGFVHWMDSGNTDSGIAVDDFYDSNFIFGATPKTVTKQQKLHLYFDPTPSGTLLMQDRTDFRSSFNGVRDRVIFAETSGIVQLTKSMDIPVTQNVYQYRLTSSSNTADPWRLNRVDLEGSDMGIGKA